MSKCSLETFRKKSYFKLEVSETAGSHFVTAKICLRMEPRQRKNILFLDFSI